jgi:hypothetical protein
MPIALDSINGIHNESRRVMSHAADPRFNQLASAAVIRCCNGRSLQFIQRTPSMFDIVEFHRTDTEPLGFLLHGRCKIRRTTISLLHIQDKQP